jgi:hypothetical protein
MHAFYNTPRTVAETVHRIDVPYEHYRGANLERQPDISRVWRYSTTMWIDDHVERFVVGACSERSMRNKVCVLQPGT